MVRDLCELPQTNRRPRWFGPVRTVHYYWARLTKGDVKVEDLPWAVFGPDMLTYVAKKYGMAKQAQKRPVFYPVRWQDARLLFAPADLIESMIKPETRAVHMHNAQLGSLKKTFPPEGSYIDLACRRHEIATSGR